MALSLELADESEGLTQTAARELFWRSGIIAYWYLYPYQIEVYDFIRRTTDPFFEATRRFGKTTTELTLDIEDCLKEDQWIVRWCEPWKEQARNVVIPEMGMITASCPRDIAPRFYRTDSFYEFPSTGSRIYLLGVNEDRGESARGSKANKVVRDEFGSWKEAQYISAEVLMPLLITTGGQMATMGTPPDQLDHEFYTEKKHAIAQKRFIARDFEAVKSIPDSEKERFIESMGGRSSTAVRRELFLEPVSDPEKLVIPEYREDDHDVPDDYPKPHFIDAYVGMDLGFHDHTGALFGYWDFLKRELVIEDEYEEAGVNSKIISEACQAKELELWGTKRCTCALSLGGQGEKRCVEHGLQPYLRVADNELQQLWDMQTLCGYYLVPTQKDDKIAALNALRLRFTRGQIKIKKRCESLRYQLKVGLWNSRRTSFERGEKTGHLDLIDALIYLSRNINEQHNPYPYLPGVSHASHHVPENSPQGHSDKSLKDIFEPYASGSEGEFF